MPKQHISNPHKKAIAAANAKYFKLYSPTEGEFEGTNLSILCRDRGLRHSDLRKVYLGLMYSSQGFYQSEEYYLDKEKWYADHPIPTSKCPGVSYSRGNQKWTARLWYSKVLRFCKFFNTEEGAIAALKKFTAENYPHLMDRFNYEEPEDETSV